MKEAEYHKSRRMFCILGGKVEIADKDVDYSHADWFEMRGWDISGVVRGVVEASGDVRFYVDDFSVNSKAEKEFFLHLRELVDKLGISLDAKVLGGGVKGEPGTVWKAQKEYGLVKDFL
jgi:hypothetical protein